jgi:hypothetical protein
MDMVLLQDLNVYHVMLYAMKKRSDDEVRAYYMVRALQMAGKFEINDKAPFDTLVAEYDTYVRESDTKPIEQKWKRIINGMVSNVMEMFLGKKDDEVTVVDQTLSFTCPLGMVPIRVPVKGLHCKHVQCFDLMTFLNVYQSMGDNAACPACYKKLSFAVSLISRDDVCRAWWWIP